MFDFFEKKRAFKSIGEAKKAKNLYEKRSAYFRLVASILIFATVGGILYKYLPIEISEKFALSIIIAGIAGLMLLLIIAYLIISYYETFLTDRGDGFVVLTNSSGETISMGIGIARIAETTEFHCFPGEIFEAMNKGKKYISLEFDFKYKELNFNVTFSIKLKNDFVFKSFFHLLIKKNCDESNCFMFNDILKQAFIEKFLERRSIYSQANPLRIIGAKHFIEIPKLRAFTESSWVRLNSLFFERKDGE